MSQEQQQPTDKRTATQRIEDLEQIAMSNLQTLNAMAKDIGLLKDAVKLLGNKTDSIVKVISSGGALSDQSISETMIANNVTELQGKVANLVTQGILAASERVTTNSFVVGQEVDENGKVVNPRIQFTLGTVPPEAKEKLLGAAVGDRVSFGDGKLKFDVLESYEIQEPKAPTAEDGSTGSSPSSEASASESAPAAQDASAEAPSSDASAAAPSDGSDAEAPAGNA